MKKKIMVVYGTRPELIKLAPLILALQRRSDRFETFQLATAQHRQMLDQMLEIFGLTPDEDLNVMTPNQTLEGLTSLLLTRISGVLDREKPGWVVVQGDTTTAMAASLAAFYKRIPILHVEAGLRTDDIYNPFPEEINRRIVSVMAALHCAPTEWSAGNLRREGIPEAKILVTGNTVVDALKIITPRLDQAEPAYRRPKEKAMVLVTAHRRENFGAPMERIFQSLLTFRKLHPEVEIVYPVHPNPNVSQKAREYLGNQEGIHLLPPQDYLSFLSLLRESSILLTDSGGVQEEAPTFGKPVLVMRKVTERPEGVDAGIAKLVGTEPAVILEALEALLREHKKGGTILSNPYGDGRASERIVQALEESSL
ncbi:MAG TPA: UDP-N-acetylglucosamine 2-epimerase (non-hydrolyzing) [Candidatus Aminicenantes bacterium]|nr:UDP-N-acetylglucosamine 2-epimerase (non-hydrolyzing) [Candidatus Aminicenantes bacterium]HPS98937.1 UDP-N-acetylglucosamine 2-epimerase (non-hydrolyzing) [Candidatus Aminicenantes bacterium]